MVQRSSSMLAVGARFVVVTVPKLGFEGTDRTSPKALLFWPKDPPSQKVNRDPPKRHNSLFNRDDVWIQRGELSLWKRHVQRASGNLCNAKSSYITLLISSCLHHRGSFIMVAKWHRAM